MEVEQDMTRRDRTRGRTRPLLLLTLGLALIAGLVVGPLVSEAQEGPKDEREFVERFVDVYSLVRDEYVEEVDGEKALYSSIQGMLSSLDPHSNFLPPDAYKRMQESQHGSFSGLGIMVGIRGGKLTVVSPIEGTPAHRAGLRSGDVIAEIDGEPTRDMLLEIAVTKLRGPKGTSVTITIRRPGVSDDFPVTIVRDDIASDSVDSYYMIRPGIGLIRIKDFNSNTTRELRGAILELQDEGMDKLLLDLRNNPGGLLDQAVRVSEVFLNQGELVVETRGRVPGASMKYAAQGQPLLGRDVPVVVLVNRASASASEIVAGAIQDHDRGLIVGETTWGKGLVQSVYPIEDAAMALTTARYYTPSGRLIQRDYTSYYDYMNPWSREENEEGGDTSYTDSGREVHGGGGITPDVIVEAEPLDPLVERLWLQESVFFEFATRFVENDGEGDPAVRPLLDRRDPVARDFRVDEQVLAAFREFLSGKEVSFTEEEYAAAESQIRRRLRAELVGVFFGFDRQGRVLNEGDPQIETALGLFERAAKLARERPPLKGLAAQHRGTIEFGDRE
jgi:carboxyl-terminal processing protease